MLAAPELLLEEADNFDDAEVLRMGRGLPDSPDDISNHAILYISKPCDITLSLGVIFARFM